MLQTPHDFLGFSIEITETHAFSHVFRNISFCDLGVPQVEVALGRLDPPRGCGPAELLQAALRRELLRCLWCAGSFEGWRFSGRHVEISINGVYCLVTGIMLYSVIIYIYTYCLVVT